MRRIKNLFVSYFCLFVKSKLTGIFAVSLNYLFCDVILYISITTSYPSNFRRSLQKKSSCRLVETSKAHFFLFTNFFLFRIIVLKNIDKLFLNWPFFRLLHLAKTRNINRLILSLFMYLSTSLKHKHKEKLHLTGRKYNCCQASFARLENFLSTIMLFKEKIHCF